jgi:GPN-loop GTPase
MLEQDKTSMLHLTRVIDRATGSIFVPPSDSPAPMDALNSSNAPPSQRPNTYSLFSSALGDMKGAASDVRDVQERWIDAREEWDAFERRQWRHEGETAASQAQEAQRNLKIRERK